MFIILLEKNGNKNINNIMYGNDIEVVQKWVYNFLIKQIEEMEMLSLKNTLGYKITEDDKKREYKIIREYKEVNKGYIYNSYETKYNTLLTVVILEFKEQYNKKLKFLQQYQNLLEKQKQNKSIVDFEKEKRD